MPLELADFQRSFAAALDRPAAGAMAVYRNTVIHGSVEALRANFPVVEQILGEQMFERVAVDYAGGHPPRAASMALYGAGLADWLDEQPWVADLPYLPDVARVERLWLESLMSADTDPLEASLVQEHLGRDHLALHPSVRFGWFATPAMSIWLAHQRPIAAEIAPEWKAEGALFVRPSAFVLHAPRIGPAAYRLLFGLRAGETLADSIAKARFSHDENCKAILASLANLGVFAAPHIERTNQ